VQWKVRVAVAPNKIPCLSPFSSWPVDIPAAIACSADGLQTLCQAIQTAELEETLSGGMFTVFAPTNEAFEAIPSDVLEATLADVDELTDTLLYHVVVDQKLMSSDLPCEAGNNVLEMANIKDTRTLCVGDVPAYQKGIGNSLEDLPKFVVVDVEACNGVVHIIDRVLLDNSFL
jgi:transforming growth factor-beta-induced protein